MHIQKFIYSLLMIWIAPNLGLLQLKILWIMYLVHSVHSSVRLELDVQISVWVRMLSFLLGKYLEVYLLGHRVGACLTLRETARPVSKVAAQFHIPARNIWGSVAQHLGPRLAPSVVACMVTWTAFPWWTKISFRVLIGNSSFVKCLLQSFPHFIVFLI